jgi:transketolase
MRQINDLKTLSQKYRKEIFEKMVLINQGHPGSIFSMMDLVVSLYYKDFIRFDNKSGKFIDKLIVSKGHATAAVYPILRDFGVISQNDWENWGKKNKSSSLRVFGNTSIDGVDITSGSLGHGVGAGAGLALSYKNQSINKNVYVIISEGELYEGSTWEALLFAKHHNLKNLKLIIDVNSLIILGNTKECLNLDPIKKKIMGLDIDCMEIDGHNFDEIVNSLNQINSTENFSCIVANTIKGKGSSIMENKKNWHYWNKIDDEQIQKTLQELS